MDNLQQIGLALIQALQSLSPGLDGAMQLFTALGRLEFYLLVIPFIYWAINRRLGWSVLLVLGTADVGATLLKLLVHEPRPYWLGGVKALAAEPTYSLPSSHASDSIAFWGYLAVWARNRWLWLAAAALVFLIGLSRVYLGVHFPHDVAIGWLLGGALVWLGWGGRRALAGWVWRWALPAHIAAGLALSAAVLLAGQLEQVWRMDAPDPEAWSTYAAAARSPAQVFALAGALFGAIAGYALMRRYAPFQSTGPWRRRGARYVLGLAGTLLIYVGLDFLFGLFAPEETALGYVLRYLRYAAVTFWVTYLAPWLFLRAKLAERDEPGADPTGGLRPNVKAARPQGKPDPAAPVLFFPSDGAPRALTPRT
jgi:membrane-associated phospholipid phosphatase